MEGEQSTERLTNRQLIMVPLIKASIKRYPVSELVHTSGFRHGINKEQYNTVILSWSCHWHRQPYCSTICIDSCTVMHCQTSRYDNELAIVIYFVIARTVQIDDSQKGLQMYNYIYEVKKRVFEGVHFQLDAESKIKHVSAQMSLYTLMS